MTYFTTKNILIGLIILIALFIGYMAYKKYFVKKPPQLLGLNSVGEPPDPNKKKIIHKTIKRKKKKNYYKILLLIHILKFLLETNMQDV